VADSHVRRLLSFHYSIGALTSEIGCNGDEAGWQAGYKNPRAYHLHNHDNLQQPEHSLHRQPVLPTNTGPSTPNMPTSAPSAPAPAQIQIPSSGSRSVRRPLPGSGNATCFCITWEGHFCGGAPGHDNCRDGIPFYVAAGEA
jgi:hypothetical protein